MKINKGIANLIFEMEHLVGKQCYNPNSYDGYTGEQGRSFRYPVYILKDKEAGTLVKTRQKIENVPANNICTMKYKFGSNHLFIGDGLISILDMLEKRYDLDFNELEKKQKK
ncbi:MAG: hypothetical protein RSA20_10680 [Oscillospiraceae bacterium]